MNPLMALTGFGQSVWLDYIRRSLLTSGELRRLIEEDGLRGVTSNPAIFEKAIAGSSDYEATIDQLRADKSRSAKDIYEEIAIKDIQDAADQLKPVYQSTNRRDGYVSLEVSPELAYDTKGTIDEALRLWKRVARENVMIKVPATPQGVPAIKELLSQGLNVNVTLLFALEAYEKVADAYQSGLEAFAAKGGDLKKVASVASFFISRIDSLVDAVATAKLKASTDAAVGGLVKSVMGRVAIANARITYQRYKDIVASPRWQALAKKGAQTQRLLWASTSTKNPSFRDVIYVEELIGADTVNTIPPATYDAFRDHGRPRKSLEEALDDAHDTMETLAKVGISMEEVTGRLLDEGVRLFADAFEKLLGAVEAKRATAPVTVSAAKTRNASLPKAIADEVDATLRDWQKNGKVQKLWAGDASVWTGADEARWLGWLGVTDDQLAHIDHFESMAKEARAEGFTHALLLGMGGSSLCPEVMRMTFGKVSGFPELCVLDSTDPAQIRAIEKRVDLAKTLFIVSSKSGGTLEPNIFQQYFFARAKEVVGAARVGSRFVAVTDPGSKMQQVAEANGFRHVFFGLPTIGGRYSALSDFGMVPAAVMGVDVRRFLDRASQMVQSCKACVPAEENPGVALGAILGVCGKLGRDKVTLIASPAISDLGAWLEQLLAESTGKIGKGLVPVDREALGSPEVYGADRVFAYTRYEPAPDAKQDAAVAALEKAGHPVVRIPVKDLYDIGQEFFRWEIATAVAGSILGINPFDQPDVEASKVATRKLTSEYETTGSLRPETPILEADGVKVFTDATNAAALSAAIGRDRTLAGALRAHLGRVKAGDYVGLLAYVEMNAAHEEALQGIRTRVRDTKRVATCLGFGPRFLHSTGQAYKGGPNSGVFIQVTADDAQDLPVPGAKYTFGVVKAAQARGDFDVLAERGRRALRVHLGKDVPAGLATLRKAIDAALA